MGVAGLYPDPPQLSVSVYADQVAGRAAYAAVCGVLEERGASPTGRVDTAPAGAGFDAVSDLAEVIDHLEVGGHRFAALVRAGEAAPAGQAVAVRAGYTVKPVGLAVVTYERRAATDAHPVAVLAGSGALGLPDEARSGRERREADKIGRWARETLRAVCAAVDPLYGALAVEDTLPTPHTLASRNRLTNVYVSDRLLATSDRLERRLRECYEGGDAARWEKGIYLSGWAPFNEARRSVADPHETGRRTASLLAAAALPRGGQA